MRTHGGSAPVLLCGCKADLRHDKETLTILSKLKAHPVTSEEVLKMFHEICFTCNILARPQWYRNQEIKSSTNPCLYPWRFFKFWLHIFSIVNTFITRNDYTFLLLPVDYQSNIVTHVPNSSASIALVFPAAYFNYESVPHRVVNRSGNKTSN